MSSSGLSVSPSSSTASSPDSRSSPGCATSVLDDLDEVGNQLHDRCFGLVEFGHASPRVRVPAVSAWLQSRSSSARSVGMPSSSEMTWNGTGNASSSISSIAPDLRRPLEHGVDHLLDTGRRTSIARGVNAFDTRRRSRVWSGGSRLRIDLAPPRRRWRRRTARSSVSSMVAFSLDVAADLVAAQGGEHVGVAGQHDLVRARRYAGASVRNRS